MSSLHSPTLMHTHLCQPTISSNLLTFILSVNHPADVISTVEFNQTGDLLATGDKGGRVVIFQRETEVSPSCKYDMNTIMNALKIEGHSIPSFTFVFFTLLSSPKGN